jgi:hypothetical protein
MRRVEREGLCKIESLDIFYTWYVFGGMNRGLTMTEVVEMPLWLRKDIRFIMGQMSVQRHDRKNIDLARKEDDVKGSKRRRRRGVRS